MPAARRLPPLAYASAPWGAWRVAACAVCGLVAAVLAAWAIDWAAVAVDGPRAAEIREGLRMPVLPAAGALAFGATFGATFCIAFRVLPLTPRRLAWDGIEWRLLHGGQAHTGRLALVLDLGAWMLLRFEPEPRTAAVWLPVAARSDPAHWSLLRALVWNWREPATGP